MNNPVLSCDKLSKSYQQGTHEISVLNQLSMAVRPGEKLAIVGASGSGKSTLLNMLGGLDSPSAGEVMLAGQSLNTLNENQRGVLRNRHLGFVYQFHHLLAEFTALENTMMPLLIGQVDKKAARNKAVELLDATGLGHRLQHKPAELSGGERQRVAIARSMAMEPQCVLMDEPTGNLDETTAATIWSLLLELNQRLNTSFVIVTHDRKLADSLDRTLLLNNGRLHAI